MKPIVFQNIYNQYRHSVMQNLIKAIKEFCDDEYTWVNQRGQCLTLDELLSGLSVGQIKYEKWQSDRQSVRFFGECAVLSSTDSIIILNGENRQPMTIQVTAVFIKKDNRWKMVNVQFTPAE